MHCYLADAMVILGLGMIFLTASCMGGLLIADGAVVAGICMVVCEEAVTVSSTTVFSSGFAMGFEVDFGGNFKTVFFTAAVDTGASVETTVEAIGATGARKL